MANGVGGLQDGKSPSLPRLEMRAEQTGIHPDTECELMGAFFGEAICSLGVPR